MDKDNRYTCTYKNAEYRTSPRGNGLWIWRKLTKEWVQLIGTCDFYVSSDSALYRKVQRLFKNNA